jgi:hypothetical protein
MIGFFSSIFAIFLPPVRFYEAEKISRIAKTREMKMIHITHHLGGTYFGFPMPAVFGLYRP